MIYFKWWSKKPKHISVGVLQLDITGLPGTSKSYLYVLASKQSLPKIFTFLYLYEKYLSCFSVIKPFLLKLLNILLLVSDNLGRFFTVTYISINVEVARLFLWLWNNHFCLRADDTRTLINLLITIDLLSAEDLIALNLSIDKLEYLKSWFGDFKDFMFNLTQKH